MTPAVNCHRRPLTPLRLRRWRSLVILEKPMGLQSPDGLRTRLLFLNVLRSEQDRLAGI